MKKFEDLEVYKKAFAVAIDIYKLTNGKTFDSNIKNQIQRAALSIPLNIAEGFELQSNKQFVRYLYFSKGSSGEVRSLLKICEELKYRQLLKTTTMKKIYSSFIALLFSSFTFAQIICNPSGNLILFSNYDGGTLNINVDQNIPNLKIGIVSYEAVSVAVSGPFAGNLTEIAYAGYNNSPNINCVPAITTTAFSGIGSATSNIAFLPPATLANPNGYTSIDCAYSCSITTNQGGCNTVDQVEDYFMNLFTGSTLFMHKVQYVCWAGATHSVSNGGTCCALPTGITNYIEEKPVSVFPNPNDGRFTLRSSRELIGEQFYVFDLFGKCVFEGSIHSTIEKLNLIALDCGVYFLKVGDELDSTIKIVKFN